MSKTFKTALVIFILGVCVSVCFAGSNEPAMNNAASIKKEAGVQVKRLSSKDPKECADACLKLLQIEKIPENAIPKLVELLEDKSEVDISDDKLDLSITSVAQSAALALGASKSKDAVEPLIDVLNDEDNDKNLRMASIFSLAEIKDPRAIKPIIGVLDDESFGFDPKKKFIDIIASFGSDSIKPLIRLLNNSSTSIRIYAASALGKSGDKTAVSPLIDILLDQDNKIQIRSAAASALTELKDPRCIEPFLKCLKEDDHNIRHLAAVGLTEFSYYNYGNDVDEWNKWWDKNKIELLKKGR